MENETALLNELIRLSTRKEVPYTVAQLKKMKFEKLEEVMAEYKQKELDRMNELLVDLALGKFEEIMKGAGLIKLDSNLARNLQDRKLFRNDFKSLISAITPLLPYVGLLEGIVVCGTEVFEKFKEDKVNRARNKNEDNTSEAEEGRQSRENVSTSCD